MKPISDCPKPLAWLGSSFTPLQDLWNEKNGNSNCIDHLFPQCNDPSKRMTTCLILGKYNSLDSDIEKNSSFKTWKVMLQVYECEDILNFIAQIYNYRRSFRRFNDTWMTTNEMMLTHSDGIFLQQPLNKYIYSPENATIDVNPAQCKLEKYAKNLLSLMYGWLLLPHDVIRSRETAATAVQCHKSMSIFCLFLSVGKEMHKNTWELSQRFQNLMQNKKDQAKKSDEIEFHHIWAETHVKSSIERSSSRNETAFVLCNYFHWEMDQSQVNETISTCLKNVGANTAVANTMHIAILQWNALQIKQDDGFRVIFPNYKRESMAVNYHTPSLKFQSEELKHSLEINQKPNFEVIFGNILLFNSFVEHKILPHQSVFQFFVSKYFFLIFRRSKWNLISHSCFSSDVQ